MPFTDLTAPPAVPTRNMDPEDFIDAADAFVAWLATFQGDLDTFISELEATAALIAAAPAYADTALKVIADASLTPAANKMILYTSSSVAALTSATTAGLALLGAADAAAQRTALSVSQTSDVLLKADNLSGIANAATARSNISAAKSGANTDITSLEQDVDVVETGTVGENSIGYRGVPRNLQASGYTLQLSDAGKCVSISSGDIAIPADSSVSFPIGTEIHLYRADNSSCSVTITDDTLDLSGTTTSGTRTLAGRGYAVLWKRASTAWVIRGDVS